jgi:hypothetical protein
MRMLNTSLHIIYIAGDVWCSLAHEYTELSLIGDYLI